MSVRGYPFVLMAVAVLGLMTPRGASAQGPFSIEDIRSLLGGTADIEEAALFAATRSSYKRLCDGAPFAEVQSAVINRLNYGSLDKSQQAAMQQVMANQMKSNETIFTSLESDDRKEFCFGLDRSVTSYVAKFIETHPHLFKEK